MIWPFKRRESDGMKAATAALDEARERAKKAPITIAEIRLLRELNGFADSIYYSMAPDDTRGKTT